MTNTFTLKYDKQGGYAGHDGRTWTDDASTIEVMIEPPGPVKNHNKFLGYCRNPNGSGTIYDLGDFIVLSPGITTLYAIWEPLPYSYDLHYDGNGGGNVPEDRHWEETSPTLEIQIPSPGPYRTGYEFIGWSRSSSGNAPLYDLGDWITLEPGRTVLYAAWAKVQTYTMVYNPNGGQGGPSGKTWTSSKPTQEVQIPITEPTWDKNFIGWSKNTSGGTIYQPLGWITVKPGTTTLYAQWEVPYVPVTDVTVTGPEEAKVGTTFRINASVSPSDATNRRVNWSVERGLSCVRLVSSGSRWVDYEAVEPGLVTIMGTSDDDGTIGDVHYMAIVSKVTGVSLTPDDGTNRQVQGQDKRFTATVEPAEADDRRVRFSLSRGGDSNEIDGTTDTTCTVRSKAGVRGDYTLKAVSAANAEAVDEYSVRVDRVPVTHGSEAEPVRDLVTAKVEDVLGDTYYIEVGYSVNLSPTTTPGHLVKATAIVPEGSGMVVGQSGDVTGTLDRAGTYTIQCTYNDQYVGVIPYDIVVHAVEPVEVPATAVRVTGPTEMTVGSRVTLTAVLEPPNASLPGATFTPLNGRVRVVEVVTDEERRETTCVLEGHLVGEVVVRVTSEDGRALTDYIMTVTPSAPSGTTWTMDAGAGSFPNGKQTVTGPVTEEGYYLPDWTVVDYPGHRLTGWVNASTGETGAMAQFSTQGVTWIAQWTEDVRVYGTDNLPRAATRIYRDLDEYIDVTDMYVLGGEPVIAMAENRPEAATLSVVNAFADPSLHLLGAKCSLWSKGPDGPISPGMYVRIEDIRPDGTVRPVLDGFITSMTPDAEAGAIRLEVGDRKTFLGRSGTTLRRNYYIGREADTTINAGYDGTHLYGDLSGLPGDSQVEPPYEWLAPKPLATASDGQIFVHNPEGFGGRFFECRMAPLGIDVIQTISIKAGMNQPHLDLKEYISKGIIRISSAAGDFTRAYTSKFSSRQGDFSIDFTMASYVTPGIPVRGPVTISLTTNLKDMGPLTYHLTFYTKDDPSASIRYYSRSVSGGIATEDKALQMDVKGFVWAPCDAYRDGSRMIVRSITGYDNFDAPEFYEPKYDRMRVQYISEDIPTTAVMSGIARAVGQYPLPNLDAMPAQATGLKVFRTGGGYAQDYLQKLADISSQDGRMRSFRSRGYRTPVLLIGTRHRVADAPSFVLAYGGDVVDSSAPIIRFSSFSPNLTMKNRPSLIMVRGTGATIEGTPQPLMVAVEDVVSRRRRYGMSVEQVLADSSVTSPLGAARAGYAQVNSRDLDRWEGTMVLPGIIDAVMELTGRYAGSGVPVLLQDSRNGLAEYPARVKEARLDYNACTTTVTLVNYGLVYSSGLGDTVATAITAADVATGSSDMSLYSTQYVRVEAKVPQNIDRATLVNTVTLVLGDGTESALSRVTFLDLPDNRTTLVAVGPPDGEGHSDNSRQYDVVAVKINGGTPINIPVPLRPDYYVGQTLIVNLDFPTN